MIPFHFPPPAPVPLFALIGPLSPSSLSWTPLIPLVPATYTRRIMGHAHSKHRHTHNHARTFSSDSHSDIRRSTNPYNPFAKDAIFVPVAPPPFKQSLDATNDPFRDPSLDRDAASIARDSDSMTTIPITEPESTPAPAPAPAPAPVPQFEVRRPSQEISLTRRVTRTRSSRGARSFYGYGPPKSGAAAGADGGVARGESRRYGKRGMSTKDRRESAKDMLVDIGH
ncbi:uncharacterized protein STEHIDRAFT_155225 [Stereum hirsutum FP-91666 SS1]|uniref:uncharacterized protein n=1 Tax=Stereum hirsutum (strain FP-91666) TaxID=721885 RepID=UPI000440AAE5|nr:uncharacterized protein STEHIDRAFT_155225 [Stereum hirsutum FP-91666 SS1]EIM87860.1 hypothetical protein STEHIDRAFT_155225 [Stereum hirsutum FP-91666 SS1]